MTIQLPPDVEAIVKAKVASGAFANESEVLAAAVRFLETEGERQRQHAHLKELIREGVEAADRGELYDADEVFDEILRDLDKPQGQPS
jgi:antitoxin ParD1/3/4